MTHWTAPKRLSGREAWSAITMSTQCGYPSLAGHRGLFQPICSYRCCDRNHCTCLERQMDHQRAFLSCCRTVARHEVKNWLVAARHLFNHMDDPVGVAHLEQLTMSVAAAER